MYHNNYTIAVKRVWRNEQSTRRKAGTLFDNEFASPTPLRLKASKEQAQRSMLALRPLWCTASALETGLFPFFLAGIAS